MLNEGRNLALRGPFPQLDKPVHSQPSGLI